MRRNTLILISVALLALLASVGSAQNRQHLYAFPIQVTSVYDGDTFTCNVDMGFGLVLTKQKVRLLGCDAFERRGGTPEEKAKGLQAWAVAMDFLSTGTIILVTPGVRDSFGRILGNAVQANNGQSLENTLEAANLTTGRFEETDILDPPEPTPEKKPEQATPDATLVPTLEPEPASATPLELN